MIKFAIIGCGRIAYRHIEAISQNNNAKLVALCDLNLTRANERNQGVDVKVYQDYREMLEKEDVDVVCIMTPSGMHAEHAIDIISKYRKNILIEKPFCLRVEQGEELIKLAKQKRVQLFVVHQNRLNKAVQKVRSVIEDGSIGKISLGTVRLRWSRGQSYYDRDPWRGTWALDGGVLTNQAVHHIDLLRWLVGDVYSVSAISATQFVKVDVEDTACVWIRFCSGALGIIEATNTVRPINFDLEASISILGQNGVVIAEGASVNRLTTCTFSEIDKDQYSENPPNVYGFGHDNIINNVVEVINKGGEPLISGEDALKSVKLLSAIYRSIELGGEEVFMKDGPISKRFGIIDHKSKKIADLYRSAVILGKK